MKCPCCNNKMKYKNKGYWGTPFCTGPEPDYPEWIQKDVYVCKECHIKKVNDEWKIPKKYKRPSQKQINAIWFINEQLDKDFEPVLKKQCWNIIHKYLEEAIKVQQRRESCFYNDMAYLYSDEFLYF